MIGHVIGNYKIEQKLGEGGMGTVYRGVDMMIEREVAIKALRAELASQPQVVERFRSEAVTLAKLNHPNVATLYSFFRHGDDFFMVMEFVRGVSLDQVIQQRGAIPCAQALPLFCQVLDGIDHAHDFGIIHRDIKPANMMLTQKGTLKVLDFGIARILGTSRMTRAGHLIGTIEYMSPEQVRGQETDARSDIYSLGMLLYELLTGRVPFDSQNEFELMKAQTETMPTPPRQLNPDIPPVVEQAIMRAIAKEPNERFQTAGDFRAVLLSAGFNAAVPLDPLLPGGPRSTTQPLGTSPHSNPPHSNPPSGHSSPGYSTSAPDSPANYSTVPSNPAFVAPPPPSGEASASARASTDSAKGGAATASSESQLKETRLGNAAELAGGAGTAGGRDQLRETRLGVPGAHAPVAGRFAPTPQSAPTQPSFFSRLTWVHYAGAGVAVLAVFGVLVALSLVFLFSGGGKKTPAETPAASKTVNQTVAPPPPLTQEQPTGAPVTQGQNEQAAPATSESRPTAIPTQQPVAVTPAQPGAPAAPRQASTRPAAKPKGDSAAEAARRRREAALRALDQ
jgi:serine/threonine protein kinase